MIVLEATNLHKSFRTRYEDLHVLRGVSFCASKGEVTCIVGPSGSGKSTLLHILGGLDRPDQGKVTLDSAEIFNKSDDSLARLRNEKVGFIFQFHHLLPEFTALENVMMPLIIRGLEVKTGVLRAREALRDAGLVNRELHRPNELSGGERQRVAVARALVGGPSLVLADEPSGNLDVDSGRMLRDLLWKLSDEKGLTFVIVTHNVSLADDADRTLRLVDGKLEET
jgi:lipoprotein-releasing system ATP-binding protein